MDAFHGYPVRVETVSVAGAAVELLVPADPEALLGDPDVVARFERDEFMPYWATLWPAALLLADDVARWPRGDSTGERPHVLEIGCGLGLVGVVAARRGYRVTVSDHDDDALAFAVENARRNDVPVPAARHVDWRERYGELQVDHIVAADVLYEGRNLRPVAEFIANHLAATGTAHLCDPNRATANLFGAVAGQCGLEVAVERVMCRVASGETQGRIFRLTPRPGKVAYAGVLN